MNYPQPPKRLTRSPYLRNKNDNQIYPWHEVLAAKTHEFVPHWEHPKVPKARQAITSVPKFDPPPASARIARNEHPQNIAAMPDDPEHGDPDGVDLPVEGSDEALELAAEARKTSKPRPRTRKAMPEADTWDEQ